MKTVNFLSTSRPSRFPPFAPPSMFDLKTQTKQSSTYPPYNRWTQNGQPQNENNPAKYSEMSFIQMNVAGFKKEQLQVTVDNNLLIIQGNPSESHTSTNGWIGFEVKTFTSTFSMTKDHVIDNVTLENGILTIVSGKPIAATKPPTVIAIK